MTISVNTFKLSQTLMVNKVTHGKHQQLLGVTNYEYKINLFATSIFVHFI